MTPITTSEKVWSAVGALLGAGMVLAFCFAPLIFRGIQ